MNKMPVNNTVSEPVNAYHLISVYPPQSPLVYGGRVAAEAVVEAELGRVLGRHAREFLLDAFQHADGGGVGLYYHVQLDEWKQNNKRCK